MTKALTKEKDVSGTKPEEHAATAASASEESKRGPMKSFHEGEVWCNVFAFVNETKGGTRTNYSVTVSRSYKDAGNKWRSTSFFGVNDLGTVMGLLKQAGDYITALQYPPAEGLLED